MVFLADDGVRIHFRQDIAPKNWANVLIVHGLGEHGGRYEWLTKRFLQLGINVYRIDLRGHGCSEGTPAHIAKFSQFHNDLNSWYQFLLDSGDFNQKQPLFLLGHSMGGLICLDYILTQKGTLRSFVTAAVLSSPSISVHPVYSLLKPIVDLTVPSFLNTIHVPNGIDPKYLSHDPDEVAEYIADPLVHRKITPQLFGELITAMKRVREFKRKSPLPIQFLIAEEDRVVDPEIAINFAKSLQCGKKEVRVLHGFYHEIFNEVKKADAWNLCKEWLIQWRSQAATQKKEANLSR